MSGFQSGNLREAALEMGGKYRPTWDTSCTHLVSLTFNSSQG